MKPLWLLDIDGVINSPLNTPPTDTWPIGQWLREKVWSLRDRYMIQMAIPVRDFIVQVHNEGLAEIRWHTTWQEAANNVGNAFGLPHFEVQDAPEAVQPLFSQGTWWKLPTVWRELSKVGVSRSVLWTDDDLNLLNDTQQATLQNAGCTLLCPDARTGLNSRDLAAIKQFLSTESNSLTASDYTGTVPETSPTL